MFSIITCSNRPGRLEAVHGQWRRVMEKASEAWELVAVSDARSLCEGYTRGLAASRGDLVIFAHDDFELLVDDFALRLRRHMLAFDVVGVAGTSKLVGVSWLDAGPPHLAGQVAHRDAPDPVTGLPADGATSLMVYGGCRRAVGGMQALDGVMLAFRRPVIEQVGWDAQTFTGFHFYDLDVTYRAHRAGFRLAVGMDLHLCHFSGGNYDERWKTYSQAFLQKHAATFERIVFRRVVPMGVKMVSKGEIAKVMSAISEALPE